jgi:deoxyribodipyrimidine photo-lyase
MHREHRVRDNWTLLHALDMARALDAPLLTVYCLAPSFAGATLRHYALLLRGLAEVERDLAALRVPFVLLAPGAGSGQGIGPGPETGSAAAPDAPPAVGWEIARFAAAVHARAVVADFDSLRVKRAWIDEAARHAPCPLVEVDARNVVPCRAASDKREYAARTLRPKIHRLLPEYLTPFPDPAAPARPWPNPVAPVDWAAARARLRVDRTVGEVDWIEPGEGAARRALEDFLHAGPGTGLARYAELRNDPVREATSGLSPYLHFGMLAAQRVALEVAAAPTPGPNPAPNPAAEGAVAFLEELVVRRELADNFCLHAPDHDAPSCFPDWAARTLAAHERDVREHLYEEDELEAARTHDPLWNAAQRALTTLGTMHGYLRMYWAKKILEWSPTAAVAMARAVRLNDRHFLDGREANGYAGIAWAIGGVHDRPWKERPVFGTVRYMNLNGARRKFDVDAYVRMIAERTGA